MDSRPLCKSLTIAVTLSLMLLISGLFQLGVAIEQSIVAPPRLELRYILIRIAAYRTHYPDCPPYTQCPPQSVAPPEEHYVVWIIHEWATADQPYGRTATRLLVVP
jgi:hypothetical protein